MLSAGCAQGMGRLAAKHARGVCGVCAEYVNGMRKVRAQAIQRACASYPHRMRRVSARQPGGRRGLIAKRKYAQGVRRVRTVYAQGFRKRCAAWAQATGYAGNLAAG